jgi:hypothetical protein
VSIPIYSINKFLIKLTRSMINLQLEAEGEIKEADVGVVVELDRDLEGVEEIEVVEGVEVVEVVDVAEWVDVDKYVKFSIFFLKGDYYPKIKKNYPLLFI